MTAEPGGAGTMSCAEVEGLIASYALDALEAVERAAVDAHLDECELHSELRTLQRTAAAVGFAVEPVEPPSALRARITSITGPSAAEPLARADVASWKRWWALRRKPSAAYALAAALAIIALTIGIGIGSSGSDDATQVVSVTDAAGDGDHRLVYVAEQRVAVLEIRGLADLTAGETYQVWLIRGDGSPRSLGLFTTEAGVAAVALSVALEEGDVIAVTVEPVGGSPQPTSAPLVSGTV